MEEVTIYTDGACSGNPGPGGWGAVLMYKGNKKEISGGNPDTTNNIMEITAVIEGLKMLKFPCKVNLYSDSAYVVNCFNQGWIYNWMKKGWKTANNEPVKNKELWQELYSLTQTHKVTFIKVKGHAGNPFNEKADKLATGMIGSNTSPDLTSEKNYDTIKMKLSEILIEFQLNNNYNDSINKIIELFERN